MKKIKIDEKVKTRLITLGIVVCVIVISAILIYTKSINKNNPSEEIVKCISEKAVLYVQTGCSHCQTQKDKFGDKLELLRIIDCTKTLEKCVEKGITSIPTWIFNDTHFKGVYEIEELKEIMGC